MTTYIRLIHAPAADKPSVLLSMVKACNAEGHGDNQTGAVFDKDPKAFSAIPGSPFAYWIADDVRSAFGRVPPLEQPNRLARRGAYTTDDFRVNRLWWEIDEASVGHTAADFESPSGRARHAALAKGGAFARFYSDSHLVIRWTKSGQEAKAFLSAYREKKGWGTDWSACLNGYDKYFRPGLTYSIRSQVGLSFRVLPAGTIFSLIGPAIFVDTDSTSVLLATMALLNSQPFALCADVQMAFGMYQVGIIQRTPLPVTTQSVCQELSALSRRAWSLKRSLDTKNETSHAFVVPAGLEPANPEAVERELQDIQKQIDDLAFRLYGIEPRADTELPVSAVTSGGEDDARRAADDSTNDEASDSVDDAVRGSGADRNEVMSWLVGVAFGRFDPRIATGERPAPAEPEPFDPLPSRSPGMYPESEELAERPEILVDDAGHADDLAARVIALAERLKCEVSESLRSWLAKEFFPLHIKMYSKSRRKAPIYWQLSTPTASYSVWLYIHTFGSDTLFRVQNEYIGGEQGKLRLEERRLESLTSELRDGATAAQRKQLAAQAALVDDLRAFLDEVKRVAPLWKPNLDDGVIINCAPLWRLVPQNKAWQKELKSMWDALCEGKYDWAHLAMHLWPERVVPQCAKDRSLAIAHDLDDVFWTESAEGKWTARKAPTRSVDELVRERTSPAVKSALKRLLDAPVAVGKNDGRRGGGRRISAVADEGGDA